MNPGCITFHGLNFFSYKRDVDNCHIFLLFRPVSKLTLYLSGLEGVVKRTSLLVGCFF